MLLLRLFSTVLFFACYVVAQVSVTGSTAGIPASQNVGNGATSTTVPSGLGGTSTGVVESFSPGATAPAPANSVISSTLTGSALSQYEASISSQAAHGSGSNFMYTSTTGGNIVGISTGLTGGYDTPSTASQPGASASSEGEKDSASNIVNYQNTLPWCLAVFAALMGAMVVL